jgi:hypothetical protein
VSCASAARCTAAGWWNKGLPTGGERGWAEVWNGTVWRAQPTAPPAKRETFAAVSCTAARTCTAVGVVKIVGTPYGQPLAERK